MPCVAWRLRSSARRSFSVMACSVAAPVPPAPKPPPGFMARPVEPVEPSLPGAPSGRLVPPEPPVAFVPVRPGAGGSAPAALVEEGLAFEAGSPVVPAVADVPGRGEPIVSVVERGAAEAGTFAVELGGAAPVVPVETPDEPPAAPPADPPAEPPPEDPPALPPPPLCASAGKDRAARTRVADASSRGFMAVSSVPQGQRRKRRPVARPAGAP